MGIFHFFHTHTHKYNNKTINLKSSTTPPNQNFKIVQHFARLLCIFVRVWFIIWIGFVLIKFELKVNNHLTLKLTPMCDNTILETSFKMVKVFKCRFCFTLAMGFLHQILSIKIIFMKNNSYGSK